jgi:hypothetical protein
LGTETKQIKIIWTGGSGGELLVFKGIKQGRFDYVKGGIELGASPQKVIGSQGETFIDYAKSLGRNALAAYLQTKLRKSD